MSHTNRSVGVSRGAAAVLAGVAAAVAVAAGAAGCDRGSGGSAAPDHVYTVRGVVERLPTEAKRELFLRHEAIDGFVDERGRTVGMDSMSMPFGVARDLPLAGVAVGDPVEVTFEVRWKARPRLNITAVTELPPDTRLTFERARPPGG